MVFNPAPEVRRAAEFAKEFNADQVIIFYRQPGGKFGYASYGAGGQLCTQAKRIAESMFDGFGEAFNDALNGLYDWAETGK